MYTVFLEVILNIYFEIASSYLLRYTVLSFWYFDVLVLKTDQNLISVYDTILFIIRSYKTSNINCQLKAENVKLKQ